MHLGLHSHSDKQFCVKTCYCNWCHKIFIH